MLLVSDNQLVPMQKWAFCPISSLCSKNNPRNIKHMPVVIFFACLDLDKNPHFWMDTNKRFHFYHIKCVTKIKNFHY